MLHLFAGVRCFVREAIVRSRCPKFRRRLVLEPPLPVWSPSLRSSVATLRRNHAIGLVRLREVFASIEIIAAFGRDGMG